jgi:Domain of unknown function (DUF6398)
MRKAELVPQSMQKIFNDIIERINIFCKQYLNEEYADISHKLTAALCRKRPSPLLRGQPQVWAVGIIHALGYVNFLFDSSNSPHISASDLFAYFDVSKSTGTAKSKQIRDLFDLGKLEPEWTLPSIIDKNPLVWLIQVNGFAMDARSSPLAIQEEAFRLGIIPYIPALKKDK